MGHINVRVDDQLKAKSYKVLAELGLTPSEYIRQALEYVVERERLPFKEAMITESEEELLMLVRERLAEPQERIKVKIDEL